MLKDKCDDEEAIKQCTKLNELLRNYVLLVIIPFLGVINNIIIKYMNLAEKLVGEMFSWWKASRRY